MAVIWNPSIRKSVDIPMPNMINNQQYMTHVRFGVRPDTLDPMIVLMRFNWDYLYSVDTVPWLVEVFTLSSRTWRRALCSSSNVLHGHGILFHDKSQVVIGRYIYWLGIYDVDKTVFSFDMVTEECTRVILPDCIKWVDPLGLSVTSISKLRDSLIVIDSNDGEDIEVWVMEPGVARSFTKLYNFKTPDVMHTFLGFRNNGAAIIEIQILDDGYDNKGSVVVYDRHLEHFNPIGLCGLGWSFEAHFYKETLLLL
ncbi:uncharacterized protein [Rutidosis leptorrhynchoides]|uniref:uncharacterized protein n=1 Tax=Rutidosis leptorrhynchoides TaxID=125765 RepID=UPI003A991532